MHIKSLLCMILAFFCAVSLPCTMFGPHLTINGPRIKVLLTRVRMTFKNGYIALTNIERLDTCNTTGANVSSGIWSFWHELHAGIGHLAIVIWQVSPHKLLQPVTQCCSITLHCSPYIATAHELQCLLVQSVDKMCKKYIFHIFMKW